ncbi:MAG: MmgE/PrpD family protein [Deltaproteobacteria bacterium]|nr:MmgE/PrpD family protein [Deltaproteobacteria bacterium]
MDTAAVALGRFAADLRYEDIPQQAVERTKRLILDSIGCALGAYASEPCSIVRTIVEGLGGTPESTIIGSGLKTSCPNATLANGAMIRYLDFNDTYSSRSVSSVHPSNTIAEALAVAEREHASGKELIVAVILGYEVQFRFQDTFAMPNFFHATVGGFAAPVVAGRLLGLNAEQIANAIGIAGGHNFTINSVYGEGEAISRMKCMAHAFASQSGVTAALLAQKGFTGPTSIIESYNRDFEGVPLAPLTERKGAWAVLRGWMKCFPAYHKSHTAITAVLELVREHGIKAQQVEMVHVKVFDRAVTKVRNCSRRPQCQEEADHSLPYLLAIAILEGEVGLDQFAREQWKDSRVLELMGRMEFQGDAEFDKLFPERWPAVVEIKTGNGQRYSRRVDYPKGAPQYPMTDKEIEAKFRGLAKKVLRDEQIQQIMDTAYHLEELDDVAKLMALLAARA